MHSMGMNCTRRRHRTVKPVRTNIYTKHAAEVEEDNIKIQKKKKYYSTLLDYMHVLILV